MTDEAVMATLAEARSETEAEDAAPHGMAAASALSPLSTLVQLVVFHAMLDVPIGSPNVVLFALEENDPFIRATAIAAAALLGRDEALALMDVFALEDAHPLVRANAVYQRLRWPDQANLEPVVTALSDSDRHLDRSFRR